MPSKGERRADTPLPKHIAPLPPDVPEDVWRAWPRKGDAHVIWRVRMRQIDAYCRSGKLKQWVCPDQTVRLSSEEITELFGPPGEPKEAPPVRTPQNVLPEISQEDPLWGIFQETVKMLADARKQTIDLVKLLTDPISNQFSRYEALLTARETRIAQLEDRWVESQTRIEESLSAQRVFDMEMAREQAREERRADVMKLLRDQVPALVAKYTGATLLDFVRGTEPAVVESVLQSGVLGADQQAVLRRVAVDVAKERAAAEAATAAKQQVNGAPAPQTEN